MAKLSFPKTCAWCKREFMASAKHVKSCNYQCAQLNRHGALVDRFWKFASNHGDFSVCWKWTGPVIGNGRYGQAQSLQRLFLAHRTAWALTFGEIPKGLHVLHSCDFSLCVNPRHLFLGTHADNMADMKAKGRANYYGHKTRTPGSYRK